MASFFDTAVYIRPPLIDGVDTVDEALKGRLNELHLEVESIETKLGINVAGSATNLLQRLNKRISKNGLVQGQVFWPMAYHYRRVGVGSAAPDWRELRIQIGIDGPVQPSVDGVTQSVTFPTAFSSPSPEAVFVQGVTDSSDSPRFGVQNITATDFEYVIQVWDNSTTFLSNPTSSPITFYCYWLAIGGF